MDRKLGIMDIFVKKKLEKKINTGHPEIIFILKNV